MPHHKQKAIHTILGLTLIMSCLTACEEKQAEPKLSKAHIPVKVFSGMQLGSLLNETVEINDSVEIKTMLTKAWYASINMKSLQDVQTTYTINNCNEYFKYSDEDIAPVKENERSAYAELVLMCKAAKDIASAAESNRSFLNDLELNEELPKKLPKQLAIVISTTESEKISSSPQLVTWGDVNKVTNVHVENKYKTTYSHLGAKQEIELIVQADFDSDGIEDVLISSRDSVENGSYSALRIFLITRKKQDGVYQIVKEYSY